MTDGIAAMEERPARRSKLARWWRISVIGGVEYDDVVRRVAEDAGWTGRFAFLTILSAGIALLGLLIPSAAVIIGAMLLSPLMGPIMGVGFGIATLDFQEIRRSAVALAIGAALAVSLSAVFVSLSPIQTITSEIAGRTQPTLFDLLVALLSAVAGAYALIRGRGGTVVGVAIAIALMPPLAVVGFGIATANWTVFSGSLLLFMTNAVTIALTAALVARVYGFGSHLSPAHTGWQLVLFFGALGLLSIPLGTGLSKIAFQAVAQRQVREALQSRFPSGSRISQLDIDAGANPLRVRAVVLTPRLDRQADRILAGTLGHDLSRPIDIHVDQLRISLESGEAEATQIARAAASSAGATAAGDRQKAMADVALIAGVPAGAVTVDSGGRVLSAIAQPLPGLEMPGYRALEDRANRALPDWQVHIAPPSGIAPPAIAITAGVVDGRALDLAGWGSARLGRTIVVAGGTAAQRAAVAEGITARGGQAVAGPSPGSLRLEWQPAPVAEGVSAPVAAATG